MGFPTAFNVSAAVPESIDSGRALDRIREWLQAAGAVVTESDNSGLECQVPRGAWRSNGDLLFAVDGARVEVLRTGGVCNAKLSFSTRRFFNFSILATALGFLWVGGVGSRFHHMTSLTAILLFSWILLFGGEFWMSRRKLAKELAALLSS